MKHIEFNFKQFTIITLLTSIWIHIGEILRAHFIAFPRVLEFFGDTIQIIGVEQMQMSHTLIWGAWDFLLTIILVFVMWLCINSFGNNKKSAFISGTITAFATIGIFWIATVNMGLGEWSTAFILIPIAWIELVIGAFIVGKLYKK